ncbi:caspase family protein [Piscinibacter sakaiensis]|uniref:caspase family protein n=1 Tax=Piscinibacter sakaiensis TaxID=1547922 RepID=UPI003AAA48BD
MLRFVLARLLVGSMLVLAAPHASATLLRDVIECTDERELKVDGRCRAIADEALESERLVERLADLMVEQKEHRKAAVLLATALRKFPASGSLQNRLAVAKSYADEMEAIAARERERNAKPNAEEIAASMTRIRCTRLSGEPGLAACDAALKHEPGDPALLSAKGDLLAADGRIDEALTAFHAVMKVRPDDVIVRQKINLLSGKKDRPPPVAVASLAPPEAARPAARPAPTPAPAAAPAPASPVGQRPAAASPAAPQTSPAEPSNLPPAAELEQRLAMLQTLRDKSILAESEFQQRRRKLLDAYLNPTARGVPGDAAPESASVATPPPPSIDFGNYHALIIGINSYKHLPTLDTAHNDAKAVAKVLQEYYDYKVRLLLDPTREQIIEAMDVMRETLKENDNLLIYYAGHGWLDKEADQGFWLPTDARAERRSQWLSNDVVRDLAKALKVKHMLVIADSCFSGTLTRGINSRPALDPDYLKRISQKKARQAMSSGGLEPVFDSVDGRHSPFARALVQILNENRGVIDGTTLFSDLRRPVALAADQTPEFSDIRRAGHDGGDFLFVRRR